MSDNLHLPVALRRSRRASLGRQSSAAVAVAPPPTVASTPAKGTRSKRRVRFSDPGPILANSSDPPSSTGLTPMIRRTSLSGRPQRRHSTPARSSSLANSSPSGTPRPEASDLDSFDTINFLPLRQVLDGRVKRRIRRNGLSEEMNSIFAEKKRRANETKAEIERLKASLAEKDEEIHRLQDETHVYDTERVWELEQQVTALKRDLAERASGHPSSSPAFNWAVAARDPFSDDYMDLDDSPDDFGGEFGQTTLGELACSTPTRRARASFPTPPTTSPPACPMTPRSIISTPHSHAGVQASMPDPDRQQLEDELASLQLEVCKLTTVLESYTGLTSRISKKLIPFAANPPAPTGVVSTPSSPPLDIEVHLNALLQTLSDKSAALGELDSSLDRLGFPGSDACDIIESISNAFRAARLELEYSTPGEIPLPLTSAGAAILDLLLDRLRDLSKKSRETDESIDEYHAIELSLRQQLGARVAAMDGMAEELKRMESDSNTKDARITELEIGLDRLKGAVQKYARDVSELEGLVQRMEGELESSASEKLRDQAGHDAAAQEHAVRLTEKQSVISDLDTKLNAAVEETESLQNQLASLQTTHADAIEAVHARRRLEIARATKSQGHALALRDARVTELRIEIERVNTALRAAHETVRQLRVENGQMTTLNQQLTSENTSLSAKLEVDRRKAKEVIDNMKAELEKVARMSEGFLMTPKKTKGSLTPSRRDSGLGDEGQGELSLLDASSNSAADDGGFLAGDQAKKSRGKKRRRYDSGLGFLDEEEVDA